MEQVWSSQIIIPPSLPTILKKYAKAAIRTQPYDLFIWSAAYFKAMAAGSPPPVKLRLELAPADEKLLTVGYIRLLVFQFGREGEVGLDELREKWNDVCLPTDTLDKIITLGRFEESVDWPKFVATALGFLEQSLKGTMLKVCEVLSEEPEGGSAAIPCSLFLTLYRFLGEMECGDESNQKDSANDMESSFVTENQKEEEGDVALQVSTLNDAQSGEEGADSERGESPPMVDNEIQVHLADKKQASAEEVYVETLPPSPRFLDDGLLDEEKEEEGGENANSKDDREKSTMAVAGIGPRLPSDLMEKVEEYLNTCAARQGGMVMPRNVRHFMCPPLDLDSPQTLD